MKPKLLLRIAAILMFLHTIGHTIGALTWKDAPNATVGQVIQGMEINHFEFMGRNTSLASFFGGYGYIMIVVLLFISVLLWELSIEYNRRIIRFVAVSLIIISLIEYFFFFPLAAALSFMAGISALAALFKSQKN
jgi:hypothetical protein